MKVDARPAVSVIMPAYNGARYIGKAIESVINQSMEDWELLIIDDCSKDDTYAIAQSYAKKDSRIKVYCNSENSGVSRTRNKGLDSSKGEYIALLDCDDIWRKDKLEKQIAIAKDKKSDIVYCSYALVDEEGRTMNKDFIVPEKTDFADMLVKSVISCSTVLLSREIVNKYRFSTDYYHEDYVLWLDLLKAGYVADGSNEVLAEYRILDKSRSANKFNSALRRWDIYRNYLQLPFGKASWIFLQYSIEGVKKYF